MIPLTTYSYLCQSRALVLDRVRTVTPTQYIQSFPIGPGSLAKALTHTLVSEWYYIQRMLQREVPPYETWWMNENSPPAFGVLEAEWAKQADATREAIGSIRDWNATIEYQVTTDEGIRQIVTASAADIFTQLCFHEIHHRAQALNMLRHLGITIAKDIDFNAMMYPRRNA